MARFNDQHRKTLQRMMSENSWEAIEAFRDDYLLRNYAQASIKRETEFDTMWYAAQAEGAKLALAAFFNEMEQEAARVETR
jgi:hypothetical protein